MINISNKIIIDADACPKTVRIIIKEISEKYDMVVWVISSFNSIIEDFTNTIIVGDEKDAADIKIFNESKNNDIVITKDLRLAAMLTIKGIKVITPYGFLYRDDKMDMHLERSYINKKFRDAGGKSRIPVHTIKDDDKFRKVLEKCVLRLEDSNLRQIAI